MTFVRIILIVALMPPSALPCGVFSHADITRLVGRSAADACERSVGKRQLLCIVERINNQNRNIRTERRRGCPHRTAAGKSL